jgi:uncharacterized membrane protein YphA (DoxX/SURF4 family)
MLEKILLEKSDFVVLPGRVVKPETYAKTLYVLTNNSKAYIAVLRWQAWFGPWQRIYADVCGSESPLVGVGKDGRFELLIPDHHLLQSVSLTVFYRDDSILSVGLGEGDKAIVGRRGEKQEAQERLKQVQEVLAKRGMHPDVLWSILVISLLSAMAILIGLSTTLGSFLLLAAISFGILSFAAMTSGFLRPRPNRIGMGWSAIGFTKEHLRQAIIALVAGVAVLWLGIWIGSN